MAAVVCERFTLCSLGCGWLSPAVSWLECERWYVGMAVSKGGAGGLLDVAERLDVGAVAPEAFGMLRAPMRVGFFIDV
jgi:hypothetical protein